MTTENLVNRWRIHKWREWLEQENNLSPPSTYLHLPPYFNRNLFLNRDFKWKPALSVLCRYSVLRSGSKLYKSLEYKEPASSSNPAGMWNSSVYSTLFEAGRLVLTFSLILTGLEETNAFLSPMSIHNICD